MGFVSRLLGTNNDFEAKEAPIDKSSYATAIQAAMGNGLTPRNDVVDFSNSNQARGGQQALIDLLTQASNGQGPSIAQQQLRDATNRTTAQGASMVASTRGINPAMAARMILENTANANQQAAGQSAMTRLQEMLMAREQLQGALTQQRGQDINQSMGQTEAGLQTLGANTNRLSVAGGLQNGQNTGVIQNSLGTQGINANVASGNQQMTGAVVGGILNGMSAASAQGAGGGGGGLAGMMGGAAHGGRVPELGFVRAAMGGMTDIPDAGSELPPVDPTALQVGPWAGGYGAGSQQNGFVEGAALPPEVPAPSVNAAPPLSNPANTFLMPVQGPGYGAQALEKGVGNQVATIKKFASMGMGGKSGGVVPGKAKVKGNSFKNDTVPALLSPGEVVVPKSEVTKDGEAAKEFVKEVMRDKKNGSIPERNKGFGKVLEAHKELQDRVAALERFACGGMVR